MKYLTALLYFIAIIFLFPSCALLSDESYRISMHNLSDTTVTELYVRNSNDADWGENLVSSLKPGESYDYPTEYDKSYDLRIVTITGTVFENDEMYVECAELWVDEIDLTFDGIDLFYSNCIMLNNSATVDLSAVRLRKSGTADWGENLINAAMAWSNYQHLYTARNIQYDVQVKWSGGSSEISGVSFGNVTDTTVEIYFDGTALRYDGYIYLLNRSAGNVMHWYYRQAGTSGWTDEYNFSEGNVLIPGNNCWVLLLCGMKYDFIVTDSSGANFELDGFELPNVQDLILYLSFDGSALKQYRK